MFHSLTGTLIQSSPRQAVISCGGVGFSCAISLNTAAALPSPGEAAMLYTHLAVREDALDLFGFSSEIELDLFRRLITVSGVGAKVAMQILSTSPPDRIMLCIAAGDAAALKAPGVGPKLAQRMALELKDKVGLPISGGVTLQDFAGAAPAGSAPQQAVAALVGLGYTQSEAAAAVNTADPTLPTAEIIRIALQGMGGKR